MSDARFEDFRGPDESGAEARAWAAVRSAYLERSPEPRPRSWWRAVAVPVLAVVVAGLALSPAGAKVGSFGAKVGHLITRALGVQNAAPALFSLPAPGRILVSGPGGTWTADADGSARRLGPWQQASWSPHGLFVAVAGGDELAAVDPRGTVRWRLARPAVSDPRWFSPSGYRIAYLSAGTLRVVAGDGTGDHVVASGVAQVAPAWRPGDPYQLAYETVRGRLVVRDGDTGARLWSVTAPAGTSELAWAATGQDLLALAPNSVHVYAAGGRVLSSIALPRPASAVDGALSPNGRLVALVVGRSQVMLARVGTPHPALRPVLTGSGVSQVSWSPDGRWLLVSWPAANQWVFVRVVGGPRVAAVSRIAEQFSSAGATHAFPQLDGWCCTAQGPAG
jgi:hypothetical protein